MKFKFAQSQIAVITALCVAFGHPAPADLPRWNGEHIDAFNAIKQAVANTKMALA